MLCPTCPLESPTTVQKRGNQCAECDTTVGRRKQASEQCVKEVLIEQFQFGDIPLYTSANKPITRGGVRCNQRPDFYYDCGNFVVINEVDEGQHRWGAYNPHRELVRMDEMAKVLSVPIIFIRFNPDAFQISGMTERVPKKQRYEVLVELLKEHLAQGSSDYLTISYLFYDQLDRLMEGEKMQYVTTKRFPTASAYKTYVDGLFPSGCANRASGTPWYTLRTT